MKQQPLLSQQQSRHWIGNKQGIGLGIVELAGFVEIDPLAGIVEVESTPADMRSTDIAEYPASAVVDVTDFVAGSSGMDHLLGC